jgi:hypothetical protein
MTTWNEWNAYNFINGNTGMQRVKVSPRYVSNYKSDHSHCALQRRTTVPGVGSVNFRKCSNKGISSQQTGHNALVITESEDHCQLKHSRMDALTKVDSRTHSKKPLPAVAVMA